MYLSLSTKAFSMENKDICSNETNINPNEKEKNPVIYAEKDEFAYDSIKDFSGNNAIKLQYISNNDFFNLLMEDITGFSSVPKTDEDVKIDYEESNDVKEERRIFDENDQNYKKYLTIHAIKTNILGVGNENLENILNNNFKDVYYNQLFTYDNKNYDYEKFINKLTPEEINNAINNGYFHYCDIFFREHSKDYIKKVLNEKIDFINKRAVFKDTTSSFGNSFNTIDIINREHSSYLNNMNIKNSNFLFKNILPSPLDDYRFKISCLTVKKVLLDCIHQSFTTDVFYRCFQDKIEALLLSFLCAKIYTLYDFTFFLNNNGDFIIDATDGKIGKEQLEKYFFSVNSLTKLFNIEVNYKIDEDKYKKNDKVIAIDNELKLYAMYIQNHIKPLIQEQFTKYIYKHLNITRISDYVVKILKNVGNLLIDKIEENFESCLYSKDYFLENNVFLNDKYCIDVTDKIYNILRNVLHSYEFLYDYDKAIDQYIKSLEPTLLDYDCLLKIQIYESIVSIAKCVVKSNKFYISKIIDSVYKNQIMFYDLMCNEKNKSFENFYFVPNLQNLLYEISKELYRPAIKYIEYMNKKTKIANEKKNDNKKKSDNEKKNDNVFTNDDKVKKEMTALKGELDLLMQNYVKYINFINNKKNEDIKNFEFYKSTSIPKIENFFNEYFVTDYNFKKKYVVENIKYFEKKVLNTKIEVDCDMDFLRGISCNNSKLYNMEYVNYISSHLNTMLNIIGILQKDTFDILLNLGKTKAPSIDKFMRETLDACNNMKEYKNGDINLRATSLICNAVNYLHKFIDINFQGIFKKDKSITTLYPTCSKTYYHDYVKNEYHNNEEKKSIMDEILFKTLYLNKESSKRSERFKCLAGKLNKVKESISDKNVFDALNIKVD